MVVRLAPGASTAPVAAVAPVISLAGGPHRYADPKSCCPTIYNAAGSLSFRCRSSTVLGHAGTAGKRCLPMSRVRRGCQRRRFAALGGVVVGSVLPPGIARVAAPAEQTADDAYWLCAIIRSVIYSRPKITLVLEPPLHRTRPRHSDQPPLTPRNLFFTSK